MKSIYFATYILNFTMCVSIYEMSHAVIHADPCFAFMLSAGGCKYAVGSAEDTAQGIAPATSTTVGTTTGGL